MYDRNYYLAHREEIIARVKKWQEENPERYRRSLKRCRKKNLPKYKIQNKFYRCANWDKIQKKHQEYMDNNKDKFLAYIKKYREENIDKIRAYDVQRKANKRYSKIQNWSIYYEIQNGRFKWFARKGKYEIFDDKINGFPTLRSAQLNAKYVLG